MDSEHAYLKTTTHLDLVHPNSFVSLRASFSLTSHQHIHHVRLENSLLSPLLAFESGSSCFLKSGKFSLHVQREVSAR